MHAPYISQVLSNSLPYPHISQWLALVLGHSSPFNSPVDPEIDLICLSSVKSFAEFEFCAKKAISGSYGLENSQKFLKKVKNF